MPSPTSWILTVDSAGSVSQARGLAEAADLSSEQRLLRPKAPWRWVTARVWPAPLRALPTATLAPPMPDVLIGSGGMAAAIGAALHDRRISGSPRVVHVQHPGLSLARFDLVFVNEHDGLTGPNVIVTRTALHRVTPERLMAAAAEWRAAFAHLPRPLVAVLVGGGNVRFRLDAAVAGELGRQLAAMMDADRVGIALTPSHRTSSDVAQALAASLRPKGAYVWDGTGDNPYFGMLALADAIVVTQDSVSMLSEAVATTAPVMLAVLPGHSRRQEVFTRGLLECGRVRRFGGRLEMWPTAPLNDTPRAGAELRRRLGF